MVLLAGIGVGGDGCFLAPVNAAKIGFRDVGAQPDVIEVGEGDDGRAGRDNFAEFGLAHGDHTGRRRTQGGVLSSMRERPRLASAWQDWRGRWRYLLCGCLPAASL